MLPSKPWMLWPETDQSPVRRSFAHQQRTLLWTSNNFNPSSPWCAAEASAAPQSSSISPSPPSAPMCGSWRRNASPGSFSAAPKAWKSRPGDRSSMNTQRTHWTSRHSSFAAGRWRTGISSVWGFPPSRRTIFCRSFFPPIRKSIRRSVSTSGRVTAQKFWTAFWRTIFCWALWACKVRSTPSLPSPSTETAW